MISKQELNLDSLLSSIHPMQENVVECEVTLLSLLFCWQKANISVNTHWPSEKEQGVAIHHSSAEAVEQARKGLALGATLSIIFEVVIQERQYVYITSLHFCQPWFVCYFD